MDARILLLALILTACASQPDRRHQVAAWQRCVVQSSQAHTWLSDCY